MIEEEINRVKKKRIKPEAINKFLKNLGTSTIDEDTTVEQLLKRPEVSYSLIKEFSPPEKELGKDEEHQVEIQVKYEGYIIRQMETAEKLNKIEGKKIPEKFDYSSLSGISKEILLKLEEVRPENLGQASRIQGMTPVALSLIMVAVEKMKRTKQKEAREN